MKNIPQLLLLVAVFLLTACSEEPTTPEINISEIRPYGGIISMQTGTRGDGMINSTLNKNLNVQLVRLDAAPAYPADYSNCTTLDATISSYDNTLAFIPAQYYKEDGASTRLTGWYPATGSFDAAAGKVTFESIDGSTDIMTAAVKEGSKATPIQHIAFKHILTQVSIQTYATSAAAVQAWGGIESIVIKNKKMPCEIILPATDAAEGVEPGVNFDINTATDLPLVARHAATNTVINGEDGQSAYRRGNVLPLGNTNAKAVCGYAMFPPHNHSTDGELIIEVQTEKGGKQTARIASDFLKGTSYILTFSFAHDQMTTTAGVTDWQSGDNPDETAFNQPDELAQALAYREVNDLTQTYSFFHKPTDGWVGDPMPFYENGKYHVFYLQDARDGAPTFHPWYEATTTDFVTYTDNGLMIPCGAADGPEKALGTGSVFQKDGVYYAFYTAHNGDAGIYPRERILMATSTNLHNWQKVPESEFVIKAPTGYAAEDFRDPIIFFDAATNNYKMLISTRSDFFSPGWTSVLAQYTSTDLRNWTMETPFYNGGSTYMVECPDVFIMGDYQYLIYSDIDDRKVHYKYRRTTDTDWTVPAQTALDGVAFYAGKTAGDGTNRYLFGWCPTRIDANDQSDYSWAGALVVHRLIQQGDGTLKVTVPQSVEQKIAHAQPLTPLVLRNAVTANNENYTLTGGTEKALAVFPRLNGVNRISASIAPTTAKRFGIEFAAYDRQEYVYDLVIDIEAGVIRLDQKINQAVQRTLTSAPLPAVISGSYEVTVIVENSVCVAYVNNEVALSNRIYAMTQNPWGIFTEDGEANFVLKMFK